MLQKTKHREIIYHIIEEIFSGEYRTNLALRGDILSYFIYGLDRFTTDISIDMVRIIPDESRFQLHIESILNKYGRIKQKSQTGLSFYYSINYGESNENIIIEIHTKVWEESLYEIANIYGLEILAQERSTLFANKLIDITNSKALVNRDLYDIYFYFVRQLPINQLLIEERTSKNLREYLIYLLDFINKKINPDNVLDGFDELLEEEQKIFVQQKLFYDVVRILQSKISDI